jgi:uroporphyrinogen-III synthase
MSRSPRIVLTRERDRNRPWAERLTAAGLDVCELPLVTFTTLEVPEDLETGSFDWILFTSPQGVRSFKAADIDPGTARMAALSGGTAAALVECGWQDSLGLRTRDGVEFAQAFLAVVQNPGPVLLPGANRRLPEPRASLTIAGFKVRELPLYETRPVDPSNMPAEPCDPADVIFFCSPSAVKSFIGAWTVRPRCVAIGRTTAEASIKAGFETAVAASPDLEAMVLAAGLGPLPVTVTPENES